MLVVGFAAGAFRANCYPLAPEPGGRSRTDATLELAGLQVRVEHTPGHTRGSVVLHLDTPEGGRLVLTGDTVFAGPVGPVATTTSGRERAFLTGGAVAR